MPLLNVDWEKRPGGPLSFLHGWSATIADSLNEQIPRGEGRFLAEMACRTRFKTVEEIAGFDRGPPTVYTREGDATDQKYPSFDAPVSTLIAPARFTDRVGVTVIDSSSDRWHVAAAVLFVTPDNKADSDSSLAFAVRAAGFMSAGAGVVIVDALPGPPSWATHLHSLTGVYPITKRPRNNDAPILAVHPTVRDGAERFAVWHHAIAPGFPLPTVPVSVRGAMHLKLDLEATYAEACTASRIP